MTRPTPQEFSAQIPRSWPISESGNGTRSRLPRRCVRAGRTDGCSPRRFASGEMKRGDGNAFVAAVADWLVTPVSQFIDWVRIETSRPGACCLLLPPPSLRRAGRSSGMACSGFSPRHERHCALVVVPLVGTESIVGRSELAAESRILTKVRPATPNRGGFLILSQVWAQTGLRFLKPAFLCCSSRRGRELSCARVATGLSSTRGVAGDDNAQSKLRSCRRLQRPCVIYDSTGTRCYPTCATGATRRVQSTVCR